MTTKKDFDNIKITFPANTLICGPTQSGKTTIVKKILTKYDEYFDYILIFGKNLHNYKEFRKVTIFNNLEIYLLQDLYDANEILRDDNLPMKKILVIFDDILATNFHTGEHKTFWNDFLSTCRNKQISCIFSIQYLKGINPAMRKNMLYYFVTDDSNEALDTIHPFTSITKKNLRDNMSDIEGYESLFISRYKTQKDMCIIKE
jgi:hypothetical protein